MSFASEEFWVTCSVALKLVLSVTCTLCPPHEMLACAVKPKYISNRNSLWLCQGIMLQVELLVWLIELKEGPLKAWHFSRASYSDSLKFFCPFVLFRLSCSHTPRGKLIHSQWKKTLAAVKTNCGSHRNTDIYVCEAYAFPFSPGHDLSPPTQTKSYPFIHLAWCHIYNYVKLSTSLSIV